jgi:hypothetical protein
VTPVGRGENADRTLHDERVVRRLVRAFALPAGGGKAEARLELPLQPSWGRRLGVVAFVQEPSTLRVLAAVEGSAGTKKAGRRRPPGPTPRGSRVSPSAASSRS